MSPTRIWPSIQFMPPYPALAELCAQTWDKGNAYFPATSMQISNLNAGTGANNVIPATLTAEFNFRFSTETTDEQLKATHAIFDKHFANSQQATKSNGNSPGNPFFDPQGKLVGACQSAIQSITGTETELSTSGGTSDGRLLRRWVQRSLSLACVMPPFTKSMSVWNWKIWANSLISMPKYYKTCLSCNH